MKINNNLNTIKNRNMGMNKNLNAKKDNYKYE